MQMSIIRTPKITEYMEFFHIYYISEIHLHALYICLEHIYVWNDDFQKIPFYSFDNTYLLRKNSLHMIVCGMRYEILKRRIRAAHGKQFSC